MPDLVYQYECGRKHVVPRADLAHERGAGLLGRPLDLRRLLRQAAEIERAAQEAYTALVSQIRPRDYMLSAAFMLVDEVRHLTVWRRVLGLQIY